MDGPGRRSYAGGTMRTWGYAMSGLEPIRVDPAFWRRVDVSNALGQRDIGALFRLVRRHAGASQHRIGTAVDIQQGTVSAIMRGDRVVTSIDVLERIADGLGIPDEARVRIGLAPKEDHMHRRTALGIGLAAAISPATLTAVLRESAAEAVEFARHRGASAVGAGTLDHLTTVVAGIDRAYPWQPATELFPLARAYRQYVEQLLDGRHTLAEARELHVHAAYLSHILSDLALDLGSTVAAKAFANDAYGLAEQAGHNELCAWAADSLAATMRWSDEPAATVTAAQRGLRRVPRRHPLSARLHARAARGYAALGNRDACTDALTRARTACDRLPEDMPSRFGSDSAEHVRYSIAAYAAECHISMADWASAAQQAEMAFGVRRWSNWRAAGAHLDLAVAKTHLGSPEEALEHAKQAVAFGLHRGGSVLPRLHRLDAALISRYAEVPGVQEFHGQYRQLASQTTT